MGTILHNNSTTTDYTIADISPNILVPKEDWVNLEALVARSVIQSSGQLLADIGNPAKELVVNDGVNDLSAADAIRHILQEPSPGPLTSSGKARIQLDPSEASRIDTISPNWCDKTTWFEQSTEIAGETLTDSGDGLSFNSVQTNWIDVSHGKLSREALLQATYKPIVKADGVAKTESSPGTTDGDYQINYATGVVTFNASQSGKTIMADYHHAAGSLWTVKPSSGKKLIITEVEVQFSTDVVLNSTVIFQLYVGGSPYGNPTRYQTAMDYINEASRSWPTIPVFGGGSWRGLAQPVHIFRWPYSERGATVLRDSLAMELRIWVENDIVFGGSNAVATFYGISESE